MTMLVNVDGGIDWTGGKRLKDLDYADDMKSLTELVVTQANKVVLKINTMKTEIMKIHISYKSR